MYPTYDANGNIGQLINGAGSIAAAYTYDPFGNVTEMAGAEAAENPWRFSTKPVEAGTGWLYYGYRWYDAEMGRWVNRDPIEESGGVNLYGFVGNDGVNWTDALGLSGYIDSGPFYRHWLFGKGKDYDVAFSKYDPGWEAVDFPGFDGLISQACAGELGSAISVDIVERYDTNAGPGNVDVKLVGEITKVQTPGGCGWRFDGSVVILDNVYDFDSKQWGVRDGPGGGSTGFYPKEWATRLNQGGMGWLGTDYTVIFDGDRGTNDEGECP